MTFTTKPTYTYSFKSEDQVNDFIKAVREQFPEDFVDVEIQDTLTVKIKGTYSMNYNMYLKSELEALSKQL